MTIEEVREARVLVTGASGFIGTRLCERLSALGNTVFATSRRRPQVSFDPSWAPADLHNEAATRAVIAAARPDIIFHLGGHVAGSRDVELVPEMLASNLVGTVNVLLGAYDAGVARVVLAGSMEEPIDVTEPPSSPYAAAKFAAAAYARMFNDLYDLPTVTLRLFMVYGPGQFDERKVIPHTILSLLRGETPKLTSATRPIDWVYIDDAVDAVVRAATAPCSGQSIEIGSGSAVTVRDVVELLSALIDAQTTPEFGVIADRPHETLRVADVGPAEKLLAWRATTPLQAGLARTVAWFSERQSTRAQSLLPAHED